MMISCICTSFNKANPDPMSLRPKRDASAASDKAACRLQSVLGVGHSFRGAQQAWSTSAAPGEGGGALVGPGGNGLARAEVTTPNVQYDDGRMQGGLWGGRTDEAKPRRPWETVAAEKEARFVTSMEHLGGKYSGQVKDGVPSGFGTLKWAEDGKLREYKGAWRDGASNGDGTLTSTSSGFTMKAEGAFGKNFQPVDAKVEYRHGWERLELASVTATPYFYGGMTGGEGTWYTAAFSGYKDANFGMELYGVEDDGVSAAHIEWSGKSLDDFATSLMNEESNAVLSGRVAFRPPSHLLKEEGLDDSVFLGMIEVKNGKARWRSDVRRHVGVKDGSYSETTIGDAAETWKADAFDLEGMNDQRMQEEVQRKIDLLEHREWMEEIMKKSTSFLNRALLPLTYGMMAVIALAGAGLMAAVEADKRQLRKRHAKIRLDIALFRASMKGDLAAVNALLAEAWIDVNCKDDLGRTPLMAAATWGGVDVVERLLAAPGIDVNAKDSTTGRTALMNASYTGNTAVVEVLLAAPGIDVNAKDKKNRTALMAAAEWGRPDVVERLLAAPGIDINAKDKKGWTALRWAGHHTHIKGKTEVAELLRAAGAIEL